MVELVLARQDYTMRTCAMVCVLSLGDFSRCTSQNSLWWSVNLTVLMTIGSHISGTRVTDGYAETQLCRPVRGPRR